MSKSDHPQALEIMSPYTSYFRVDFIIMKPNTTITTIDPIVMMIDIFVRTDPNQFPLVVGDVRAVVVLSMYVVD